MNILRMIRSEIRRSGIKLQTADADDLVSSAQLEILQGATPRLAVGRVVMRFRRAWSKRPLPLRVDVVSDYRPR